MPLIIALGPPHVPQASSAWYARHIAAPSELRAACNLERKTGRALPKRLSAHQRTVVDALIAKHGDDVQVSVMQKSCGTMAVVTSAYEHSLSLACVSYTCLPCTPPPLVV